MAKALSFLSLLALPVLCFAGAPSSASASSGVSIQFGSAGLTSLQWNGVEMLASGVPTIGWIGLIQPDGTWGTGDSTPTTTADITNCILTQKYAWGAMNYAYTTTDNQLFVDVTIANTSTTPVGMFILQLAEIQFPSTPSEYDGSDPMVAWNMGNPSVIPTTFNGGKLDITNEDVTNPLLIGWPWSLDAGQTTFPLVVLTGKENMLPTSYPFINRRIAPGSTLEFKIGFRFGPQTATDCDLAGDIYQLFAATYPYTLAWSDHRPIAQLFLTSYNGTYPANPRRWFGDPSVDITTRAGVEAFHQQVLAYADQAIAICKAENAQAAITWDIEGEQFPQAISYIGDPRLVDSMAPEIAGVIDAYFKKFTDAGIKIGMTIRPQRLVRWDNNRQAAQEEVSDPGRLMIEKIAYARKRWGASVFYVDSNGGADNPMDVSAFKRVTDRFPDILLVPEESNMEYYSITAPYGQLNMGVTGPPQDVLWTYPDAFRVFTISDADVTDNLTTLIDSVAHGDVLFFRGWFDADEDPQVQQIYQEAAAGTN